MTRRASPAIPHVVPIPWREPLEAACGLEDSAHALALVGGGGHPLARWSFLADGPVDIRHWTEGAAGTPFDGLQARLDQAHCAPVPGLGPFQGGWAGLLSYELGRAFERLPWPGQPAGADRWPDVALGLYDTVAVFDRVQSRAHAVSFGLDAPARRKAEELAHRMSVPAPPRWTAGFRGAGLNPQATRSAVEAAVAACVELIHDGDIFQANISQAFKGRLPPGDTPMAFFQRLAGANPAPFAGFLSLGDRAVVSHTPERFLTRSPSGALETRPIKGTRPRGATAQADQAALADLVASAKDRAENLMIVDLMRNDLSRVCMAGSVTVPSLIAPESFSTVHHLVSRVTGQMKPGLGFFDALVAAFPAGSITGAPKVRAMEIIAELEGEARGPWCGSMIWAGFDGAGDSSVLIRTAACVRDAGGWAVTARAGAGIVADSDPAAEHDEMLVKAHAVRAAAAGPSTGEVAA